MTQECDLAIVGAGPGGYVAALRAAQLGMKVTLVERAALGGVCLNRGCIPTKAMLHVAALLHEIRHAEDFGIVVEGPVRIDYPAAVRRREQVVSRLTRGVGTLLKHAKVQVLTGEAAFAGPTTLEVSLTGKDGAAGGHETVAASHIMVATGSRPADFPVPGAVHPRVIDSDGALALDEVPRRLLVIGGGAVGCEWSTIFARFGAEVTLVEMLPSLLPREDTDLGAVLADSMTKMGVAVRTGTSVASIAPSGDALAVELTGEHAGALEADYVLVAAGRAPLTEGLGLAAAGVATTERGWVIADQAGRTNVPSVLAIGDVTGGALLAHVASRQGVVAVETLAGHSPAPVRDDRIPSVTYTDPEVASVGLTESAARDLGLAVEVGRFPFSASGRAVAAGTEAGLVKVVADSRFGRVLGVHMIGPHVGELLAEAVLALELEATLDEMTSVIRAHPTLSEAVGEGSLAALGIALHTV
ncbi:MAG: dihydrolipoyl dehydrogenase [Actinobacteria bacterium]|nr:dihydrolipoyl dehydrogenase [Actinomycetota bacterium]